MTITRLIAPVIALIFSVIPAVAQGLFSPVLTVNDLSITQYELEQRERLLSVLRTPGDPVEEARTGLIEDRLRLAAARRAGLELTEEGLATGIEEFAGRANLNGEQFLAALAQEGVAEETLRDLVSAGLLWREVVQGRFGAAAQVSPAEVDRALELASGRGGARVLLSEIIVPLTPENENEARQLMADLSDRITTLAGFASAARQYSASRTARIGGRLDWLPIANVPPQIRAQVLTLNPGQVTDPVVLGPGIGIFQLRALEETESVLPDPQALEYVEILIPGGQSEAALANAAALESSTDTCDDLYTPAKRLPAEYFQRVIAPIEEVPTDVALALAKLDPGEVSTELVRQDGEFLAFLRLCGRTFAPRQNNAAPSTTAAAEADAESEGEDDDAAVELTSADERAQVRQQLFQQRLNSLAEAYLQELRADAIIIEQ